MCRSGSGNFKYSPSIPDKSTTISSADLEEVTRNLPRSIEIARSLSGIGSLEARINNLRAIPGL